MAIEILKEKCTGCGLCFKSCPYDAFEFEPYEGNKLGRVAKVNAKCSFCNQCLTACRFGAIKEVQTASGDDRFADYKHIWVYAEQRHGKIQNVALELIGEGRKLAKDISEDTQVCAVLVGDNIDHLAQECFEYGAEKVYIVYRRGEDEMPARKEEIHHAKEEGIELRLLNNPVRILGNEKGWVSGLECIKMELGEPDASGRRSPVEVKGSEYVLDVDMVVMAIGQGPNPLIKQTTPELEVNKRGNIVANEVGATSIPGVFAGGDIVTGAATVISAMGAGKRAAAAIDEYLQGK